jgi:hypothetical protein
MSPSSKRAVKIPAARDGRQEPQDLAKEDGLMAGNHARGREVRESQAHGRGNCCGPAAGRRQGGEQGCPGFAGRRRHGRPRTRRSLSRRERCGKRRSKRHSSGVHESLTFLCYGSCSDSEAAHDVAEVLSRCARLDLLPPGWRIHVELGEGAHEDRFLRDPGVLQQIGLEADASLLVERE